MAIGEWAASCAQESVRACMCLCMGLCNAVRLLIRLFLTDLFLNFLLCLSFSVRCLCIYACVCSSVSSRSGSADVLEELGVPMLLPDGIRGCIDQANIAFMFAPNFHPAMKHVVPVRSPTCFVRPFLPPFWPSSMVHCGRGPLFGLAFVCCPRCARPWVFARFLISLVLY